MAKRVFFVVGAPEVNNELFETLEEATNEYNRLQELDHDATLGVYIVNNAYIEESWWTYEDKSDTFELVKELR